MIVLYSGGGAQVTEVLHEVMSSENWQKLKAIVGRMLRARGKPEAATLLEKTPFELREGTNGFNDEFTVLHWLASFEDYVQAADWKEKRTHAAALEHIAKTTSEVLNSYVRFVTVELDTAEGPASVESPTLQITNDIVERALHDAQHLIANAGGTSGLDRVHTTLHAYLRAACDERKVQYGADASITDLFKGLVRQGVLRPTAARSEDIERILKALAVIVDALNPLRNRGSMAHPNANLLDEPEAMLAINTIRTLLHYLNARLQ
jgi:Abortive infection C-terminus